MLVDQAVIDQINGRMRRRVLELPVKRGKFGEAKKCPLREGGIYTLNPRIPYDTFRSAAEQEPTRARAVLRFVALCEAPTRSAIITVTSVERQETTGTWLVRFEKGAHPELFDTPIYLAPRSGYTTSASRQAVPGDPEVLMPLREDLERARRMSREGVVAPQRATVRRAAGEFETLKQSLASMKARNRLKLILREMAKLDDELSAEVIGNVPGEQVCAAPRMPAREGEAPDLRREADVRLETAA